MKNNGNTHEEIFICGRSVMTITGWSRSTLNRKVEKGIFPRPVYTGENFRRWLKKDVDQWINNLQQINQTLDTFNKENDGNI